MHIVNQLVKKKFSLSENEMVKLDADQYQNYEEDVIDYDYCMIDLCVQAHIHRRLHQSHHHRVRPGKHPYPDQSSEPHHSLVHLLGLAGTENEGIRHLHHPCKSH
jgi:hypothetical protein